MAAAQLFLPASRAFNSNGLPVAGAVLKLYTTGTNTPQPFYSDAGLSISLGFSVTANAAGRFETVYQDNATPFRLRIEDSFGAELDDIDPYYFGRMVFTSTISSGVAGLFIDGNTVTIPDEVNMVVTTGRATLDVGGALYVRDAAFDLVTYPLAGFTSANGVKMRLSHEQDVNPFMFGAVDGTNPRAAGETVTDCSDALDAMWAFVKYMSHTRGKHITMDLSGCLGLGISRTWTIDTGTPPNFWLVNIFRIKPGRLVAMASLDIMVKLKGGGFEVGGQWELYGNVYDQLILGYGYSLAKRGLVDEDTGGSNIGSVMGEGFRRYGLDYSKAGGTNNIPITAATTKMVRCGNWGSTGGLRYNGTYASGSWTNQPANNGSYDQLHRMTLTPQTGVDPTDLEVGDLVWFDSTRPGVVRNVISSTSTTITVDIYPYQQGQVSGTFRSMHGGAVDFKGANLANCNHGLIEAFVCGTGIRVSSQYAPTIRSLLAESCAVDIQIGGVPDLLQSIEGLHVEHAHLENCIYSVVDVAGAASACWIGTPSNFEGTNRGKFDKALRMEPASIIAGVWTAPIRTSLRGIGFKMNGGAVESPTNRNIEYNGPADARIGNSPENQFGPCKRDNFDYYLNAERSMAEQLSGRNARMVHWGPIYGTGTHGAPTGNVTFTVDPFDAGQVGITIEGAAATYTLTSADGALMGVCVYEPPNLTGDNGNWKIFSWKATGA